MKRFPDKVARLSVKPSAAKKSRTMWESSWSSRQATSASPSAAPATIGHQVSQSPHPLTAMASPSGRGAAGGFAFGGPAAMSEIPSRGTTRIR
jgi:hypothetical protein